MKVELLPHQHDAMYHLFDDPNGGHKGGGYQSVCLLGGIGSGKTFLGSVWIMRQLQRYQEGDDGLRLICASTYGQLRRATLAEVFTNLNNWGVSFSFNQNAGILDVEGCRFLCLGVDRNTIDNVRGISASSLWGDEFSYWGQGSSGMQVYNVISGRVRDPRGDNKFFFTTSPNGHNHCYDLFHGHLYDNKMAKLVRARTKDNYHLDEFYYERLKSQMDDKMMRQELEAEWVTREGIAYYGFKREIHTMDLTLKRNVGQGFIGLDFNVSPMCATIIRFSGDRIYVIDELHMHDCDTFKMARELKQRGYGNYKVIADSTFNQRKTAGKSDKIILEENGFDCSMTRKNPYVVDRVALMNKLFQNNQFIVDKKCKMLIRDFEQVTFLNNKLNQISNPDLTHQSDSASYPAWRLLGFTRPSKMNVFTRNR